MSSPTPDGRRWPHWSYTSQRGTRKPNVYLISFRESEVFKLKKYDAVDRIIPYVLEVSSPAGEFATRVLKRWVALCRSLDTRR